MRPQKNFRQCRRIRLPSLCDAAFGLVPPRNVAQAPIHTYHPIRLMCVSLITRRVRFALALCLALVAGCYGPTTGGDQQDAVARLLSLQHDPSPELRRTVALSLGKIGSAEGGPALVVLLRDGDARVRAAAAWGLAQLGESTPPEAAAALVGSLGDEAATVRSMAAVALGEVRGGGDLASTIAGRLKDFQAATREAAAAALLNRGFTDGLAPLAAALDDQTAAVRQAVVAALGETGQPEAAPLLVARLDRDAASSVRSEAAYRLGVLGQPNSLVALQQAQAKDTDTEVRRRAAWAIEAIQSNGTRPASSGTQP